MYVSHENEWFSKVIETSVINKRSYTRTFCVKILKKDALNINFKNNCFLPFETELLRLNTFNILLKSSLLIYKANSIKSKTFGILVLCFTGALW